jgi:YHS domain-containing protein
MKSTRMIIGLGALALGLSATSVVAHEAHKKEKEKAAAAAPAAKGTLHKLTEKDAAWAKKERAAYPLTVCLTSDEKLGSMGDNAEFIYREQGKGDRLVVFCCAGCEEDFLKEPAKYLAKIDAAAKQKKAKS